MNKGRDELERLLRTWTTWYRLRRAAQGGMLGLLFGLAAWCGIAALALAFHWLTRAEYLRLGALSVCGILLLSASGALLLPVPPLRLARFFDRVFHLKERTSTAVELRTLPLKQATPEAQALRSSQLVDTLAHAQQVRPTLKFYFPWSRRQAYLLAALLVLNLGLLALGQVPFQQAAQQRQVQQAIDQAAELIESLHAQVAQDPSLSEAQRQQILQALDKAAQELQQAETMEQAVASLSEAVSELQALEDASASQQAEALRQAGSQLQQSMQPGQSNPFSDVASELAAGDLLAAAEALQNMDLTDLSAEEAAAMAEQLESAAESLASTNPALAEDLSQAARALGQGDTQAAQQALQQAAGEVAKTSQQAADARAAGQAAAQVAQGQQQLLQAAGQGTPGTGSPGTGSQSEQAAAGSAGSGVGSGAGAGESSGSETQGSEAGSTPIQPGQPSDGGEKPYTELFAPQRLGLSEGETVALPPSNQAGEQVIGIGNTAPGQPGASTVPYSSVYADYAQAYWLAFDTTQVPLTLREVARRYFSSLGVANP